MTSLAVEQGLSGVWVSVVVVPGLQSTGSIVVVPRPSGSKACGVFPDQGLNPCLLPWEVGSLPLNHRGSPEAHVLYQHSKTMQLEQGTPPGIHLVIGKVFSFTS